jgi:hypothetical protein
MATTSGSAPTDDPAAERETSRSYASRCGKAVALLRMILEPEDWETPEHRARVEALAREFLAEEDRRREVEERQLDALLARRTRP